jgi:hypothetical protein
MDGRKSWFIEYIGMLGVPAQQYIEPNKAFCTVSGIKDLGGYQIKVTDELGEPVYEHGEWDEATLLCFASCG